MQWVRERLKEEEEFRARSEKIESGTDPTWKGLCQALKDSVSCYFKSATYGRFETDTKNHHVFWARYLEDTPNRNTEKKKITVVLDASERSITASYTGVSFEKRVLGLLLEGDDVVTALEGKKLSSEEAAAQLLDPFLFPKLADSRPLPKKSVYEERGMLNVPDLI